MADEGMHRRAFVTLGALGVVSLGIGWRLFDLQVLAHDSYAARRDAQARGFVEVRRPRGTLRDARGEVLAVSVPVPSVFVVPRQVTDAPAIERALGVALRLDPRKEFVWARRRVAEEEAARVAKMPGVGILSEWTRRYPHGSTLAHVLGLTNIDDRGIEGLESALDDLLAGRAAFGPIAVDGLRRKLSYPELPPGGADAELTVDLVFQRIVEEELDAVVAEKQPKWAAAVAMDPRTGAILALANRPTFDPGARVTDVKSHQDLALTAPYEPGSTFKPFIVAGALEEKLVTPRSMVDCEMGIWKHGPRTLHDHHPYGSLSVTDVVAKSSNIGAAKIGALTLGKFRLRKWVETFGFGRRTGVELPLEDGGRVVSLARWSDFTSTSVPMGHEISVTVLQLVAAMSAIANGGKLMRPFVVRRIAGASGEELWTARPEVVRTILSAGTCGQMRDILVEVVKSGTGQKAAVEGVRVAGKTGTTQKIDPTTKQYTHDRFISSFVGFAPAEAPRVCIAVVIDEPQGEYYGGAVAAPVVGKILERGLVHVK